MSGLVSKVFISASAMGLGALVAAPALAGSLTNPSFVDPSQPYLIYEADGSSTVLNNSADLSQVLQGDVSNPGGNVELSGQLGDANAADPITATTLQGTLDGQNILISSLTQSDWLSDGFVDRWFSEAWNNTETGVQAWLKAKLNNPFLNESFAKTLFTSFGLYNRFSDPNVNYATRDNNGDVFVGLAGHLNYTEMINGVNYSLKLSEVVKVEYNGESKLLYAMGQALDSGLVNDKGEGADGTSHSGLYNLHWGNAPDTAAVPEPSTMLGLMAIGSLFGVTKRKFSSNA
ncbi:MAG: NF038130 family PEP-CTERM protein [Cyanobacteria bacterium SID2]|nr:NF038130 family PEP-CTERM protein [Cyanobacteria bacterium SID2]MBP0003584.1 NF038130 family PEP-CTERM protein [Cyanobacteria bacterium SBC]